MKYNKGFAPVLVLIIVLGVLAVGGVAYFAGKSSAPKNEVSDNSNYFPPTTNNNPLQQQTPPPTNKNTQPKPLPAPSVSVNFSNPPINVNTVYMPNTVLVKVSPHLSSFSTPVKAELYAGMTGTGQGQGTLITTNTSPQISGNDSVFSFPIKNCATLTNSNPYNNRFNATVYFTNNQDIWGSSVPIDCQSGTSSQWLSVSFYNTLVSYNSNWTATPWYYGSAAQQAQGNQELVGYKFTLTSGNQIWIGGPQNTCTTGEFGTFQYGTSTLTCVKGFRAEVFPASPGSSIPTSAKNSFGDFVTHNP